MVPASTKFNVKWVYCCTTAHFAYDFFEFEDPAVIQLQYNSYTHNNIMTCIENINVGFCNSRTLIYVIM